MQYMKHPWEHTQYLYVLEKEKGNDKSTQVKDRKQCWRGSSCARLLIGLFPTPKPGSKYAMYCPIFPWQGRNDYTNMNYFVLTLLYYALLAVKTLSVLWSTTDEL